MVMLFLVVAAIVTFGVLTVIDTVVEARNTRREFSSGSDAPSRGEEERTPVVPARARARDAAASEASGADRAATS